MTAQEILSAVDAHGVITWWPGGASHEAVCGLHKEGKIPGLCSKHTNNLLAHRLLTPR